DENWSVQGGLHRGWSQFEEDNPAVDFLGGFRWRSGDRRTTVSYTLSTGPQDVGSAENGFVYSLVIQEKLGPRSQYVLVHDLGVENNALPGGTTADWYGLNQYYIYTLNSQCAACVRAEWFRDQDGVVVSGPGNMTGVRAWSGHGFAGNFYELTAGLNWRPQANVVFRPEVRYDWYDGGSGGYGLSNQTGLPFNDGRSSSQFLTAADLILTF
ncbi:MAG: outer membrane beta-barrel protein, partial [Thermoguttaceae bacterium]